LFRHRKVSKIKKIQTKIEKQIQTRVKTATKVIKKINKIKTAKTNINTNNILKMTRQLETNQN